jgi:tetratricopeptide (TPR) repeat protein
MRPTAPSTSRKPPAAPVRRVLCTSAWRDPRTWAWGVLLGAIVFATHSNDLGNGFTYDDQYNIVENPSYRGLGLGQLRWMFTTFHMGHYQPLSWVTLGLDYVLWGEDPRGYHLTNVILHTVNALLVYSLALVLLRRRGRGSFSKKVPEAFFALLAALLFAVHPLRVESVAWVTERRDVLSSLFLLLAVLFYLHAHRGTSVRRPALWVGLALLVYACSLLSRALGVTFPVVLLLLDWYPLRRLGGRAAWRVYAEKIPFLLVASIFMYVAPLAARSSGASATLADLSLLERSAQACYGLVFYLQKTVAPFGLSPLYEIPGQMVLWSAKYVVPAVVVVLVLLAVVRWGRRWPWLTVVVLLQAVLLGPVLGFLQAGPQEVADRYSYQPAIGWAILAGAGLRWVWNDARYRKLAPAAIGASLLCLAGLAGLTWRQSLVWRTQETLWTHAVQCTPSATNHFSLAGVYAQSGRLPEAIEEYRAALRLAPRHATTVCALSKALAQTGQLDEAALVCEQALPLLPADARVHFQYGNVLRALHRSDDAFREYAEAARLDPKLFEAHLNLGGALAERGRTEEAIAELRQALALQPEHAGARYNLATALMARGDTAGAISEYRQTLAVRPDFPEAQLNLARALDRTGQRVGALAEVRAVLLSHPGHREARQLLDSLLAPTPQAP